MATNLTGKQQEALRSLVQLGRSWREEFYIVWFPPDEVSDVLDFNGDPPQISKGTIRALVKDGLLICEFEEKNRAQIVLTKESYQAVDSDFKIMEAPHMKRVFVSHAGKDIEIVNAFIDGLLVNALAIKPTDIFCTSADGLKIKSGKDWRAEIHKQLTEAKITFLIITPNYKESEMCLNEMGAAWVLSGETIPLIVEPIDYASVGVLQQVKQIEKLRDEKSLDRVKDIVQEILKIAPEEIKSDRWTAKKHEFLDKVARHLAVHPFEPSVTRDSFNELAARYGGLRDQIGYLAGENARLEKLNADLKSAITSKDVATIEKRHLDLSALDEFRLLCDKVNKLLKNFQPLVRGIIFADYSGKEIGVKIDNWDKSIDQAIASDFLKEDPLQPNWDTTKEMRLLYSALEELSTFINRHDANDIFIEAYENEFDAPLSLSNMSFWSDVLGLAIALE